MRNVEFRDRVGPGVKRRIFAFLMVVLGVGLAVAYIMYAPREYMTSMALLAPQERVNDEIFGICLNERRDNLLAHIRPDDEWQSRQIDGLIDNIRIGRDPGGLLVISIRERALPGARLFGGRVLENLYECAREEYLRGVTERNQTEEAARRERIARLEAELAGLTTQHQRTPYTEQALKGLAAAVAGSGEPEGGWQEAFLADGAEGRIVGELAALLEQARELSRTITRDQMQGESLAKWINSPQNAKVTNTVKRVVYYEDSPELVRLKDEKAKIEAERMRLLQRATSAHPAAVRMSGQIDQLQAQIEALTRLPQVVEDVVEQSNPDLVRWRKELAEVQAALNGNNARLLRLRESMGALVPQLAAHEQRRRQAQEQAARKRLDSELAALKAVAPLAQEAPFRRFAPVGAAQEADAPEPLPVLLAGLVGGLICAYFLLLSRRKVNFNVIEKPEVVKPVYPVLGRISRLSDGEECA